MLTKLLKKDFQSTARSFLPLILGFVVMSILAKILFEVGIMSPLLSDSRNPAFVSGTNEFMVLFSFIFMALYVIYVIAFYIMTYVFIISDFYKTMVSEQGYLTHTLPVKTSTLIQSKLIVAIVWQCVTGFLVILSFFMFAVGHLPQIPFGELILEFGNELGISFGEYMGFLIVCMIIGAISSPLMFYASIAIGHLFGKHRIVGAVLSYLGIYSVMQIISTVGLVAMGYSLINPSSMYLQDSSGTILFGSIMRSTMQFSLIFSIITCVLFYIITNYVLSKKLNLE